MRCSACGKDNRPGWAHFVLGNFQQCMEHEQTILNLLEGPRAAERFGMSGLPYCGACTLAAWCLVETGQVDGAFALIDRGDRVAAAAGHLYSTVPLGMVRGRALLAQGRVPEALATLEPVLAICREKKFVGQLMMTLATISRVYSVVGRHDEAIAAGREAVRIKDEARAPVHRAHHVSAVSEACLAAGRLDEAEAAAREALEWARRLAERPSEASAHVLLGEIAARRGDRGAAIRHLEAGLALATELGMTPLADRCREALAGLS